MVDTIRHTAGIGGVNPLHPLRPVSRRQRSRQDERDTAEEDPPAEGEGRAAPVESNDTDALSEEEAPPTKPGRCIDIHI